MLRSYREIRDGLLQGLTVLRDVASRHNQQSLVEALDELSGRLRRDQFNLVVLGQFKRGKTTFINALLGTPLLPTAVVPLTSVVTFLRYGDAPRAVVHFEDGRHQEIALEDLGAYVTERGNPRNQKGVKEVEIFYPSDYLREGVRIVDTPGIGSVYEHNTRVAFDFIPRADAAIFLVTADLPISEAEAKLLEDVREYVSRLFFVQNKIDLVDEQEREESLAFSRAIMQERARLPQVTLYPVSARLALQAKRNGDGELLQRSLLPSFEQALVDFLMREKGTLFLRNMVENALKLLSDLSLSMDLEVQAAGLPLASLDEKIQHFKKQVESIRQARNEEGLLIRHRIDRLVANILDADLEEFQKRSRPALARSLYEMGERHAHLGVRDLVEQINRHVSESIEHALNGWRAHEEGRLKEALRTTLESFTTRTNQVILDVLRVAEEVFGVHAEHFAPREDLSDESRFHFDVWKMRINLSLAVGLLFYLLPRRWMVRRLLRQACRRMLDQFEVHSGRARYDFVQRIQKSTDSYIASLNDKIEATIAAVEETIRRAQERKQSGEEEWQCLRETIAGDQERLAAVRQKWMALRDALHPAPQEEACLP